jgi:hypothetical protein
MKVSHPTKISNFSLRTYPKTLIVLKILILEEGYIETEKPDSVRVLKNNFEQQTLGIY